MAPHRKSLARRIKRDVLALWLTARDPRTPIAAKLVAGAVAAYALSPIDLIPDFIPVSVSYWQSGLYCCPDGGVPDQGR
jgi:uncharacterized membrane protein YkvA (DUF1232 family)